MMKIDKIQEKLQRGEVVLGTHTAMGGSLATEIYGTVGFDAVWIDTEHGPIDRRGVWDAVLGAAASQLATFVRVSWNDPVLVKPILEMGVDGIIFPMVCTAEEARKAVASCLYPPEGVRGFGPLRSQRFGKTDMMDYINHDSKKIWKMVQIEHVTAVSNLTEILQVPGLDGIIIGPCDLSGSMGLLGQTTHPMVKKAMDEIAAQAYAAGKPFGVSMGYNQTAVQEWVARGASFIFANNDLSYLYEGCQATLQELQRHTGQLPL